MYIPCLCFTWYVFTFRLCLVLVVKGVDSYNDSITDAFRVRASASEEGGLFAMAYIDEEKQQTFVSSLQKTQESFKYCPSGEKSRSVSD